MKTTASSVCQRCAHRHNSGDTSGKCDVKETFVKRKDKACSDFKERGK